MIRRERTIVWRMKQSNLFKEPTAERRNFLIGRGESKEKPVDFGGKEQKERRRFVDPIFC